MTTQPRPPTEKEAMLNRFDHHYEEARRLLEVRSNITSEQSVSTLLKAQVHATLANACANHAFNFDEPETSAENHYHVGFDAETMQGRMSQMLQYMQNPDNIKVDLELTDDKVVIDRDLLEEIQTCLMLTAARIKSLHPATRTEEVFYPQFNSVGKLHQLGAKLGSILHPA